MYKSLIIYLTAMSLTGAIALADPADKSKTYTVEEIFGGPLKWTLPAPMMHAVPDATRPLVAVKDPTIVHYGGKWHVFATSASSDNKWGMVYVSWKDGEDSTKAKPYYLDDNPNLRGYHCAPQVFYFTPQKKWYLIYQSGHPQYSTTDDISNPESWTAPQDFFPTFSGPYLDYWIICDSTHAYLFASGDDGNQYRSRTKLEDFPNGMSPFEPVIQGKRQDIFEGQMVYKLKGMDKYLTLIEAIGQARYYRAWVADRLDGEWSEVKGANTWDKPFAGMSNVTFDKGVPAWTTDISHGEILREGYNETPTIDPKNMKFLFQGYPPNELVSDYILLPYRLGILQQDKSGTK